MDVTSSLTERERAHRVTKLVLAALGALLAPTAVALAATRTWKIDASGNFDAGQNWNGGVPGISDVAVFQRGAGITYSVRFPGDLVIDPITAQRIGPRTVSYESNQLRVGSNAVSFIESTNQFQFPATYTLNSASTSEAARGIIVGETAVASGAAAATLTSRISGLSSAAATIGDAVDAIGTMNVNFGTFNLTGFSASDFELIVGNRGTGTLNVNSGATVALAVNEGNAVLGQYAGSNGTMSVNGAGSSLTSGGTFYCGLGGAGSLTVSGGGTLSNFIGYIGFAGAGDGAARVSGNGSTWTSTGGLYVGGRAGGGGSGGTGRLTIENGGVVSSPFGFIGASPNSSGAVTLSGPGAAWNITENLGIGPFGTGSLTIDPGAAVNIGASLVLGGAVHLQGGTLRAKTVNAASGGPFDWSSGTLDVEAFTGDLLNPGGTLALRHTPSTAVYGDFTQQDGGAVEYEIRAPAAQNDFLYVSQDVSLAGALEISLLNGVIPAAGDTFLVLRFDGSRTGEFTDLQGDYLGQGLFLAPAYVANTLRLVTTQAGPGDTDLDGDVDLSDLGNLASSYGDSDAGIDWINGDFDSDNDVDLNDLGTLATNFEAGRAQAYAEFQILVPEPTSTAIVGLVACMLNRRARSRTISF